MAVASRPLFLISELLRPGRFYSGATDIDFTDASTAASATETSLALSSIALLRAIDPFLVAMNVAGYEIIEIFGAANPDAPSFRFDLASLVVMTDAASWNQIGSSDAGWTGGAGIVVRVEPRLALGNDTFFPSTYGIPLGTLPTQWKPRTPPATWNDTGGWLHAALPSGTNLPNGIASALGSPRDPAGLIGSLTAHVIAKLEAAWAQADSANVAQRTENRLKTCGLASMFDPNAWQFAPGASHRSALEAVMNTGVFATSGPNPPATPAELLTYSLTQVLDRRIGAGVSSYAGGLKSALRETVDAMSSGEWQAVARADIERFFRMERGVERPAAVDMMVLLDLGLVSLKPRVTGEEALPVVIASETTEPSLTGYYYVTDGLPVAGVGLGELGETSIYSPISEDDLQAIEEYFEAVRASSATMVLNQAGDRISGYWMQRVHPNDWPVEFEAWKVEGLRDRSRSGLWFQITYTNLSAGGGPEPGTHPAELRVEGDDVVFQAEWDGASFRFVMDTTTVLYLDENNQLTTVAEHIDRPHVSDSSIRSQSDDTRPYVRDTNRAMLHPNEVALLESIVAVVAARLEQRRNAIVDELIQSNIDAAMCNEFDSAYKYFYSNALEIEPPNDAPDQRQGQPLALLARNWLRYRLQTADGNIDLWAQLAHSLRATPCNHIVDALGLSANELEVAVGTNRYEFKLRSLPLKTTNVKDVLKELGKNFLEIDRELIRAAGRLGARVVGMLDAVDAVVDVTFEPVQALFKKTAGPPENPPWKPPVDDDITTPVDESENDAAKMYGIVVGASYGAQFGVTFSFDYEWSPIWMLDDRWTPDDFAGLFASQGIDVGWSPPGALVEQIQRYWLGKGLLRTSGNLGVTVFSSFSTGWPRYAWSPTATWTNAQGVFVDLSYGITYGYLCSGVSLTDPQSWENCITSAIQAIRPPVTPDEADVPLVEWDYVCFETGRSELTAEGELALRTAITENLPVLMQTLTSLRIEGYASPNGRDLFNEALSQHRARNVLRYIQSYLGTRFRIRPAHVMVIGFGHQPALDAGVPYGTDAAEWRRVDLRINGRIVMRLPTAREVPK